MEEIPPSLPRHDGDRNPPRCQERRHAGFLLVGLDEAVAVILAALAGDRQNLPPLMQAGPIRPQYGQNLGKRFAVALEIDEFNGGFLAGGLWIGIARLDRRQCIR